MKLGSFTSLATIGGLGFVLLGLSLLLFAVQNSNQFNEYYIYLVRFGIVGVVLILVVLLSSLWRMFRQLRMRESGSRLRIKLVGFFIFSTLIPTGILFFFAVKLLNSGIDSWFDLHVVEALENSNELGQAAIDERKKRLIRETYFTLSELDLEPEKSLLEMQGRTNAYELTLFDESGKVLAFAHSDTSVLVPKLPDETILSQVKTGGEYHEIEQLDEVGKVIRVVIPAKKNNQINPESNRYLNAVYKMPERIDNLLANVSETSDGFQQAKYLQPQLRQSLVMTLSLILFIALVAAIWLAFLLAQKLAQPVMDLAAGTKDIARGVYKQIPAAGKDELGFLVDSFNQMTAQVDAAQLEQKGQLAFLDTILTNLSSGVMVLDEEHRLQHKNTAIEQILKTNLDPYISFDIMEICQKHEELTDIFNVVKSAIAQSSDDKVWEIDQSLNNQEIHMRGRHLPAVASRKGSVIVFEDVTERIIGQRNAAWSEVARRLAHEIKNPLTPIQLSAERIRDKCVKQAEYANKDEVISRGTKTIITQVEALKKMVGEFSEYARTPELNKVEFSLKELIKDVLELYKSNRNIRINAELNVDKINADSSRLRQLLHNIIKNALEIETKKPITVDISTSYNSASEISIVICDDGGGISENMLGNIFEPYVTAKPKGTGLGLAIVKRIVEEHAGTITANNYVSGARFHITLPD